MDPIVVLVSGTRNSLSEDQKEKIRSKFQVIASVDKYKDRRIILVHGGCRTGVDMYVNDLAEEVGWFPVSVPAQWSIHGKKAGPIRNQQMIDVHKPHIFLGFPVKDSKGTRDCINRVIKYRESTESRLEIYMVTSLD